MRILHILDHSIPLHSGYTFRTRAILRQQRRLGWETFQVTSAKHALSAPGPQAAVEEVEGLRFYRTPATGWPLQLPVMDQWWVIRSLERRLEQVVKEVRPDLLHAHSPALNGLAALAVARRRGLPLVYEVRAFWEDAAVDHGTSREGSLRYRATRALENRVLRQADAVTTICEGLRGDILARGIPAERVTVIPNAVDVEQFVQRGTPDLRLRERLQLGEGPVLGFIGSFYAYEGLELLVSAMPAILAALPQARLLLVGGGPRGAALKEAVDRLGLAGRVIMTGRVPHEQVNDYYDLVDLLVYPRLSMRLTELVTPLKPLEAMAQGRLVIASDVGGHRELIEDGVTGQLFKAGDPAALAARVVETCQNRAHWPRQQAAARQFVETQRNWPVSVARYRDIYQGLLQRRAAS